MINITISINGLNLTPFVKYPISYTRKNLDESLDLLELTLYATTNSEPYKPNTIVDVTIGDENGVWLDGQMLVSGDTIERVGVTNKYHHKMSLIELTYLLSLEVLPDMTITRVSVINEEQVGTLYEPTLEDVANKILKYSEGTFSKELTLSGATINILSAIKAPELTFTRYTTLEALRLVFGIAKIVPYIRYPNLINHINVTNIAASGLTDYVAKSEAFNADQFRTRLYTPVENFIGGGDLQGSIIEPANGWMTPRSRTTTDIRQDASVWKLTRPIYKVEQLLVKGWIYIAYRSAVNAYPSEFPNIYRVRLYFVPLEALNPLWVKTPGVNITNYLYEKSSYDLLPNTDKGKGNALFYEQGETVIDGLSQRPETWSQFWAPTQQAIRLIFNNFANLEGADISNFINMNYYNEVKTFMDAKWNESPSFNINNFVFYGMGVVADGNITADGEFEKSVGRNYLPQDEPLIPFKTSELGNIDITQIRARVTYTPYIKTKLITYKERKETNDPIHQTTTFYNQSANTVSDEVLGELHDKVIKRGNSPTQTIRRIHKDVNSIPNLGRLVDNYVITAEDITIYAEHAAVEYILSKDYAKLNQYVAVLEKYRQFSIPSEKVVDRQFTINEFAKFSRITATKTSSIAVSSYLGTNEINIMTIDTDAQYFDPETETIVSTPRYFLPTTNFAFNNSLVFESQFNTNALSGSKSVPYVTDRRLEKALTYVDNTGMFNQITQFRLATNFNPTSTFTITESNNLPELSTSRTFQTNHLTRTNIDIDKDARERLSISYILHHIDETQKVYLNPGWSLRNGLIGGKGYTGLRFAYFNSKPIEGRPLVTQYNTVGTFPSVFVQNTANERIRIAHSVLNVPTSNYWGVIDEDNNLLFWVNEPCVAGTAPAPLYINFSNTY